MSQAKRDENRIPTLLAVSNIDGITPVVLFADPITHRLLVSAAGGITTPGTTTDNAIVRWNGTDGSAIQDYTSNAPTISDTGVMAINIASVGTAQTVGSSVINATAAAAGAQQFSPVFELEGQGWRTDATAETQEVKWGLQTRPVQGTANPTSVLDIMSSINGAAYSAKASLTSAGLLTLSDGITVGGNIVSDTDSTDDLGTTGVFWANAYLDKIFLENTTWNLSSVFPSTFLDSTPNVDGHIQGKLSMDVGNASDGFKIYGDWQSVNTIFSVNDTSNPSSPQMMFQIQRAGAAVNSCTFRFPNVNSTIGNIGSDWIPENDSSIDLGSVSRAWAVAWIDDIVVREGIVIDAATTPASVGTTPGTVADASLTATGGLGGNTTITSTGVGGIGGGFAYIAGNGGVASAATTAATGGKGGAYEITTGVGGATSVSGSGLETGGAGGLLALLTGNGGAVTTGTGTNTGGASGSILMITGAGGAAQDGTDTGGASGSISITTGAGGNADTGGVSGDINLTIGAVGSGGAPTAGTIKLTGAIQLILGSDADGDTYHRASGTLTRLAKGADTEVLTLASGVPTWAAAGGGGLGIKRIVSTDYTVIGTRNKTTVTGSGAITSDGEGMKLNVDTSAGSAKNHWAVNVTKDYIPGSPLWSSAIFINILGTDLQSYHGMGDLTVASAGITYTAKQIGFKVIRASSGTASLFATQADGTTENASSALRTVVSGSFVEIILQINGTSSVDYFTRLDSGSLSSATNLTTNFPADITPGGTLGILHALSNTNVSTQDNIIVVNSTYIR